MSAFSVDFVSPVDFEHLAAEIRYDGQIVCRIKSERGDGELEVDFLHDLIEPIRPLSFSYSEFLQLLEDVAEEVRSLRRKG